MATPAIVNTGSDHTRTAKARAGSLAHADLLAALAEDTNVQVAPYGRGKASGNAIECCFLQIAFLLEPAISSRDILECLPEVDLFDVQAFENAVAHLGYYSTKLRLSPVDVDRRLLPCLFMPSSADGSATAWVIQSCQGEGNARTLTIFDGTSGQTFDLTASEAAAGARGTAYLLRKRNSTDVEAQKQFMADAGRTWFRHLLSRFQPIFWQLAFLGLTLNLLALASPLFVMLVYDRVISSRATDSMPMLVVGVAIALAMETVLRTMRTRLLSWLTARIHFLVGAEVFKRLMELPPAMSQRASVTAQLSRIKSFESVRDFFSGPVFASTLELPAILISVIILLFVSPVLTLVPVLGAAAFMLLFFSLRHYISIAIKTSATESAVAQRFCVEALQDREDIRANGLTTIWKNQFREISGRENVAQARLLFLSAIGEHLANAINILTGLLALYVGVGLVWGGSLTTGALVALMMLIWRSISPFYSLCSQIARFEQFRNSVRQINALMSIETEAETRKATSRLPSIRGAVDFQNVALRYSRGSGVVFHGLNLQAKPGEIIGICGSMGTGKTSVLRLVQTLAQPHLGKVLIDGTNAEQLSAHDLRRQIAYIPQTPHLYPGTIAENLRIAKPSASDEELWSALEAAGAATMVSAMPLGLNQDIKIHVRLSELIYRITFARVLLQNARIVLIDEIQSSILNTGVDKLLHDLLTGANGQRTVFFVSQRADFLRQADRIIRLRHGQSPLVAAFEAILETAQ